MRPRCLDLFCGAGGVSEGLRRAGFDVVGIDWRPQPHYRGGLFVQGDATRPPVRLEDFDFVWASPPCETHSAGSRGMTAEQNGDAMAWLARTMQALHMALAQWHASRAERWRRRWLRWTGRRDGSPPRP